MTRPAATAPSVRPTHQPDPRNELATTPRRREGTTSRAGHVPSADRRSGGASGYTRQESTVRILGTPARTRATEQACSIGFLSRPENRRALQVFRTSISRAESLLQQGDEASFQAASMHLTLAHGALEGIARRAQQAGRGAEDCLIPFWQQHSRALRAIETSQAGAGDSTVQGSRNLTVVEERFPIMGIGGENTLTRSTRLPHYYTRRADPNGGETVIEGDASIERSPR